MCKAIDFISRSSSVLLYSISSCNSAVIDNSRSFLENVYNYTCCKLLIAWVIVISCIALIQVLG